MKQNFACLFHQFYSGQHLWRKRHLNGQKTSLGFFSAKSKVVVNMIARVIKKENASAKMFFPRKFVTSITTPIIQPNQRIWVFIALCYFYKLFTEAVARMWSVKYLRNNAKFRRSMYRSLFSNKITGRRQKTLFKKWSDTSVFLWVLWNISDHLFYRKPLNGCLLVKIDGQCDNPFYTLQNWNQVVYS